MQLCVKINLHFFRVIDMFINKKRDFYSDVFTILNKWLKSYAPNVPKYKTKLKGMV